MTPLIDFDHVCSRCQVLAFDDAALGGLESVSNQDGEPELKFDEDECLRHFPLDYELEDQYPELPALSESSAGGCQICEFIKTAVLSKDCRQRFDGFMGAGSAFSLTIRLSYWWRGFAEDGLKQQGLSLLDIELCFGEWSAAREPRPSLTNAGQDRSKFDIVCVIEEDQGVYTCSRDYIAWLHHDRH
jgi:hypothetical protein